MALLEPLRQARRADVVIVLRKTFPAPLLWLLRRALAIDERSYGPDHPDVAQSLNNIGKVLLAQGRLEGPWVDGEQQRVSGDRLAFRVLRGPATADCSGQTSRQCLLPYPNIALTVADDTTPTGRRLALPEAAMPLPKDAMLVVQMHYHPVVEATDVLTVGSLHRVITLETKPDGTGLELRLERRGPRTVVAHAQLDFGGLAE